MAVENAPNRSERRRERTRRRLTDAGRELIATHGVAGLKIGELTDAADVGRGSFYNHFESKEDFVDAVVGESLEALAAHVLADVALDADPAAAAAEADRRFIGLARDDPDFARLLVNLDHGDDVFREAVLPYARSAFERGVAAGRFSVPDMDTALLTLTGGALGVIRAILAGKAPRDAESAHAELVLRMVGLPPAEAREIAHRKLRKR